jgi:ABC1 atypical kinase-like domain
MGELHSCHSCSGGASQVHLAKLRGETVVVKVQRPGLKALFDIDLKNIRVLAQWLQKLDPQSDGAARDWVAIYDECSRILYQEIDYRLEGQNADRFRCGLCKLCLCRLLAGRCCADTEWLCQQTTQNDCDHTL